MATIHLQQRKSRQASSRRQLQLLGGMAISQFPSARCSKLSGEGGSSCVGGTPVREGDGAEAGDGVEAVAADGVR